MDVRCEHCETSYRVADDKVAGRVVEIACRKCDHPILVNGQEVETMLAMSASGGGQARSNRTNGFNSSLAPQAPVSQPHLSSRAPNAVWYVSINEQQVGPLSMGELGEKIDAGLVSEYSMVWKESLDEWIPLAAVSELVEFVMQRRMQQPVANTNQVSDFEDVSSEVIAKHSDSELDGLSDPPTQIRSGLPLPTAVINQMPVTAKMRGVREPVSSSPPTQVRHLPQEQSSNLKVFIILGVAIVASLAAAGLWFALGSDQSPATPTTASNEVPVPSPVAAPPVEAPPTQAEEEMEFSLDDPELKQEVAPAKAAVEAPPPPKPKPVLKPKPKPKPKPKVKAKAKPKKPAKTRQVKKVEEPKEPTAAQKKEKELLDRFGAADSAAPAKIRVSKKSDTSKDRPQQLDSKALFRVVNAGRPGLQRCYERAVRGMSDPPTIKLSVLVKFAVSGRVTSTKIGGSDPGGMKRCIEGQVKRWRFPASAEGGATTFPLLFSGR